MCLSCLSWEYFLPECSFYLQALLANSPVKGWVDLHRTTELLGTAVELTPVTSDKGCMNTCMDLKSLQHICVRR